jgi:uncharacterized paraquat-inducible protein A
MSSLADIIEKIVEGGDGPDPGPPTSPSSLVVMCRDCTETEDLNDAGLCPRCQAEHNQGYRVQSLGGRCRNGAERDHGRLFHAVPIESYQALCGAEPGRTSVGWSDWGRWEEVTCSCCQKRLQHQRRENAKRI